jgi:hypothetical protein
MKGGHSADKGQKSDDKIVRNINHTVKDWDSSSLLQCQLPQRCKSEHIYLNSQKKKREWAKGTLKELAQIFTN